MAKPRILVTGTGAVCAAGMQPDAILDAVRDGKSAIGPIRQWDTTGWPTRDAGEIADFNARALVDDRKLHKLIRRTDLLGLYAAGTAIDASGILAYRATLDEAAAATYSDRTGVYVGSGGGNYQNQYDFFPLMTDAGGDLQTFGARARQHGEPDVAAAHAAEQRARPHRHPARPEGPQRVHHQPQRRRHAGGDRGDGGPAPGRGRSRGRGRPRCPDRAADGALLPSSGSARLRGVAPVRCPPRRQPVRRRRRRADARDRSLRREPQRAGARRNPGRRLHLRSRGPGRDPRRRRRRRARHPRGARRRAAAPRPTSA